MTTRFDQIGEFLHNTHIPLVFVYLFSRDNILKEQRERALVKASMTVKELRQQLLNRFATEEADPKEYGVYLKESDEPLPLEVPVSHITGMRKGTEVILSVKRSTRVNQIEDILMLEVDGRRFPITELPAIIGRHRPSMSDDEKREITVNLESVEHSDFISRKHARIEKRDQRYYISKITDKPGQRLLINGVDVPVGGSLLVDGVPITLGMATAVFIQQSK